jgi:hypothetical protein
MRLRRSAGAAGLLAAALALVGCAGEKTGEVTGTVTVDGQPAPLGSSISFASVDGKSAGGGGGIDAGKYTATSLPVGPTKVRIIVPKFASGKAPGAPKAGPGAAGPGGGDDRVVGELTLVTADGQSELTYEVKPGKQEKNWEMKTKK